MRPGVRKKLGKADPVAALLNKMKHSTDSMRAKVEHPFRVIKRQLGSVKARYRRLKKNTAQPVK